MDSSPEAKFNASKANKETLALIDPKFGDLSKGQVAFMAHDLSMLSGPFNNSAARFLLTYNRDGITLAKNRTDDTGYLYKTVLYANRLGVPVINAHSPHCKDEINAYLSNTFV